jgi:hypothetical protein
MPMLFSPTIGAANPVLLVQPGRLDRKGNKDHLVRQGAKGDQGPPGPPGLQGRTLLSGRDSMSASTAASAFGSILTAPLKGRSMPTITSSSERISIASSAVIKTCASRLSVLKKNVKPIVIAAPPSRIGHTAFGTVPSEAISHPSVHGRPIVVYGCSEIVDNAATDGDTRVVANTLR